MPSVPQPTATVGRSVQFYAPIPDPNLAYDIFANSQEAGPSYQSSPAVVATASHQQIHALPRRFLGLMPENVVHSDEVREKRRRLVELRKSAIRRLRRGSGESDEPDLSDFVTGTLGGRRVGVTRGLARIRIRRRGQEGGVVEEELELRSDEEDAAESVVGKGKKKRKDVWVGESFDIGREFTSIAVEAGADADSSDEPLPRANSSRPDMPTRPSNASRTTQETFVTARSYPSEAAPSASRSTLGLEADDALAEGYELDAAPSRSMDDTASLERMAQTRESQASSTRPLVGTLHHLDDESQLSSLHDKARDTKSPRSVSNLTGRLKSALRHTARAEMRNESHGAADLIPGGKAADGGQVGKSKSVQFPVHHAQLVSSPEIAQAEPGRRTKGNKAPADPGEVLSREGEDAAGTSAGAVEEAMEDWEEDEQSARPGDILMRDRMLVRVGLHREEYLPAFNEAAQRRKPCVRLEPMEEYIVVWRKGRVEFYQDYRTPLREKISGHKHLCFVIPLTPNRTSLSIFNPLDMTICLTTSISRLKMDVARILDRQTDHKRTGALLANVKNSRQYQWLQKRSKGTQVVIMKIAEKSRAMDWYWEIWRDLGGDLPSRFDIAVPALNTSVRLAIPTTDEDIVGGAAQRRLLDVDTVRDTCWDLLKSSTNVDDLLRQREKSGLNREPDLQLAWKGGDGTLDWVAYTTTVQNRPRKWAVLAGIARSQVESDRKDLQLRSARHQPQAIHLEDGSWLEEPADVEGYLIRHTDAKSIKDHIYISTHDGNIFVASMKDAHPPLFPQKEGSTPANLFKEVHATYMRDEHRRMARFIEHTSGCIDLRTIASVQLKHLPTSNGEHSQGDTAGQSQSGKGRKDKEGRMFEVCVDTGETIRLEAHSAEVAKEWVDRLVALKSYWARRHRVDARQRMDAMNLQAHHDPFAGTELSNATDIALSEIWDWCTIDGCRPITLAGRIFMRKDKWDKFRSRYVVLTGGCLVTFKIKKKDAYFLRKKRYPLFGAYIYSGMLAQDELHESSSSNPLAPQARVYQDGLQASDGAEDTTFCIRLVAPPKTWGGKRTHPWEMEGKSDFLPPELTKKPAVLLIFRARSKLERDRWVWALNAEMERQVRAYVTQEDALRNHGNVPEKW